MSRPTLMKARTLALLAALAFAPAIQADEDVLTHAGAAAGDRLADDVFDAGSTFHGGPVLVVQGETVVASSRLMVGLTPDRGAVHVFQRSGALWQDTQRIEHPLGVNKTAFGSSLALDGNFLVIGAMYENVAGFGNVGSVSSYRWAGSSWVFDQMLVPGMLATNLRFGSSVALQGDRLAVGWQNRVSLYRRTSGTWSLEQELDPPSAGSAHFGRALAFGDDRLAVGAPKLTVDGSVLVYAWDGIAWELEQVVSSANAPAGARLGFSVDLESDVLLAGAPLGGPGACHVFRRVSGVWVEEAVLTSAGSVSFVRFGKSVVLEGERIVIGSPGQQRVAVFEWDGTTWVPRLEWAPTAPAQFFADAVAADGPVLAVGAPGTDAPWIDQGAVFVYDEKESAWTDQGCAKAGLFAPPKLVGMGDLSPMSFNQLVLTGTQPLTAALGFVAISSQPVPFFGGTLKAFPWLLAQPLVTRYDGLDVVFKLSPAIPSGTELWVQIAVLDDVLGVQAVALSNAVRGVVP